MHMENMVSCQEERIWKPADLTMQRLRVKRQIMDCRACELVDGCQGPVPFSWPTAEHLARPVRPGGDVAAAPLPSFLALGEAPGPSEDSRGRPFIGRSGQVLRGLMLDVGLDPDAVMWGNTVSCWPKVGRKTRKPTITEMQSCRHNLEAQLSVAPRYVLLVGGTSLSAFRGDLKVSSSRGKVYVWMDRYIVMPIYHPASILRKHSEIIRSQTLDDLERWKNIVNEEVPWSMCLDTLCIKCGGWMSYYDRDGVPYCTEHWRRYGMGSGGEWRKARKVWERVEKQGEQMAMEI